MGMILLSKTGAPYCRSLRAIPGLRMTRKMLKNISNKNTFFPIVHHWFIKSVIAKNRTRKLVLIPKSGASGSNGHLCGRVRSYTSFNFRAPLQNRNSTWQEQPWTSQRVRNEMPPHNVQSSARSMMHLAIQQADLQPSPSNASRNSRQPWLRSKSANGTNTGLVLGTQQEQQIEIGLFVELRKSDDKSAHHELATCEAWI